MTAAVRRASLALRWRRQRSGRGSGYEPKSEINPMHSIDGGNRSAPAQADGHNERV